MSRYNHLLHGRPGLGKHSDIIVWGALKLFRLRHTAGTSDANERALLRAAEILPPGAWEDAPSYLERLLEAIGCPHDSAGARLSKANVIIEKQWTDLTQRKKERIEMLVEQLKNFDKDRLNVDEMVGLLTFGNQMAATYTSSDLETPEWLQETIKSLSTEIAERRRDSLAKELKEAKARLESLKTNEEKRAELTAKINRLTAQLG